MCAMFVFTDIILNDALGRPVHVTCKQCCAGQPVQRCSRICTARVVSCSLLEIGFLYEMDQNVIENGGCIYIYQCVLCV